MLKSRIIPILTFNGFALVKTKKFSNPRMVGNPVQAARVYNNRRVDELVFIDIFATKQKRKINYHSVGQEKENPGICVAKILPLVPLAMLKSSVVRNSNPLILLE